MRYLLHPGFRLNSYICEDQNYENYRKGRKLLVRQETLSKTKIISLALNIGQDQKHLAGQETISKTRKV
jgi:hypothetical protein